MPRTPAFPLRLTPLLLVLAVGLVACPGPDFFNLPIWDALVENVAGGASGATPCTGGLSLHAISNGDFDGTEKVRPGFTLTAHLHVGRIVQPDPAPPVVLDAYCDTGSGTPGHSQLSVPFARDRLVRVTAPDGKAHDYVLQAPGPVIEVLK